MTRPDFPPFIQLKKEGIVLQLSIQPGARRSEVAGRTGDGFLKVRVHAPAVEGKANKELIRFLAEFLDLPKSNIVIVSGELARKKRVMVIGLKTEDAVARLGFAAK
jgi:uncharacterized protein (TIGR00251 family)